MYVIGSGASATGWPRLAYIIQYFILQTASPHQVHTAKISSAPRPAAVLGFPLVVRRGADAVAPPNLVDGTAGIGLFQDRYDLRLGELRLAHGNLLAKVTIVPERSPYGPSQIGGSLRCRLASSLKNLLSDSNVSLNFLSSPESPCL